MKVLVTGASGFVGSGVVAQGMRDGWEIVAAVRRPESYCLLGVEQVVIEGLSAQADWNPALHGVDALVHAAARVHVMRETSAEPLEAYRSANVAGTLALARQAAAAGVRRFVFISSIKVNGARTLPGKPFKVEDAPHPVEPYGLSKLEAERGLQKIAAETGMEVAIVRPTLVYGPGVRANFRALIRCIQKGVPLPLGGVRNKRSLVALDNLVALVAACVTHPGAANQTFLAADGQDMSTPELIKLIACVLGKRARLFSVPVAALRAAAALLGQDEVAQRLCDSLQADISFARSRLQWVPVIDVDRALRATTDHLILHS